MIDAIAKKTDEIVSVMGGGIYGIFPDEEPLQKAIEIRQHPDFFKDRAETKIWLKSLGPVIQRYADVLGYELSIV